MWSARLRTPDVARVVRMSKSKSFGSVAGVAVAVVGLALAIPSWLLMADPTTTSHVWQLRLFGLGVGVAGWGAVLLLPDAEWRRDEQSGD